MEIYTILFNIFVVLSVASVVVLVYSFRSNTNEFDIISWVLTNKTRFIAGAVLGILISILVVVSPDIDALFQIIGFNAGRTPVSIGLALGGFLVAGVSGNKPA